MKYAFIVLLLCVTYARAETPVYSVSLDVQNPGVKWTWTAYVKTAPKLRVNLLEAGSAWTPDSSWSGILWFGTNANWKAPTSGTVTGVFSATNSYATFQCGTNAFTNSATLYGGIVMTNGTRLIEWGQGVITVQPSGGVTATCVLTL
jgi:hypothetical protein